MTNDELIRLDQRVIMAESTVASLQQRIGALESQLTGLDTKVSILNDFYAVSLRESMDRLLTIFDKATSGTTAP